MKLYATVTSERATKGQGGNKELEIKLYGDNQTHIATVYLFPDMEHKNEYMLHVRDTDDSLMFGHLLPTKGEKQKGDRCPDCGSAIDDYYSACSNPQCDYTQ